MITYMAPTVSVVLPTYNRTDLLPRTLESVLRQTYSDFECIVVDDASVENTQSVIESYDDSRLNYLEHEENRGLSAARNTGIEAATGRYLAFLDDDDEWLSEKLEKQVRVFDRASPDIGLVYCWMDYYQHPNTKYDECHPTLEGDIFEQVLDRQRLCNGSTLLVRTEVVNQVGVFDESLSRGVDGDFLRRVCESYNVKGVWEVLVKYYTDHGHQRMTRDDESGIRNHIHGSKVKFDKFDPELKDYPRRAARIHADIGHHHALLNEWRQSIHHFRQGFLIAPHEPGVYQWLLRTIRSTV